MKKYDILYMDPPWQFNKRANTSTKFGGGAMKHYPTMTMEEIKALDFTILLNDNALVYCWVTLAKLGECINTIETKNLKLVTTGFVWIKTNKNTTTEPPTNTVSVYYPDKGYSKPFYGVGNYTASNAEICLIFRKGKMLRYVEKVSQVILAPKAEHSKKPNEAYDLLNIMYPVDKFSKLELFARTAYNGFDVVGNQLNNTTVEDFIDSYKGKV